MKWPWHGAILRRANLRQASLSWVKGLEEALLQDVNLEGATGLLGEEFAGTDVTGANLPEKIAKFEGLTQTEKISQRAQKLFLSLLLGCVYCWLTIATTTDVALITNSGASPLPIIQTKIPIAGFYWAAPLILLSLYFWFHLYLQRLWEGLAELPAVFPDGKTLDKKVYPWLISGMVRSHVRLVKEDRPALSRIQTGISILLAWWLVPFTFLLLWLRYIPRHHWVGTSIHVGVLAVSITAAFMLYRLATKTLRGENTSSVSWKEKWKSLPAYQPTSLTLGILGLCVLSFLNISNWTIEGIRLATKGILPSNSINTLDDLFKPTPEGSAYKWNNGQIFLPRLYDYLGYRTYANLEEIDISTKPPNWTGQEDKLKNEIPLVKGAKLKNVNLQNASIKRAFLINAYLRGANLKKSNLVYANLTKADLRASNLTPANLDSANLTKADLRGDNLTETLLIYANLTKAKLNGANLTGVYLTPAQLSQACVDENTKLPKDLKPPEPCPEEELPKE